MRRQAVPRWDGKRWQLNAQKDGVRKSFYSAKPGPGGKAEVRRKCEAWKDGAADKGGWRLEKAWPLYLEDVKIRTGAENYNQREKLGRLYILPKIGKKKMQSVSVQDWQDCINHAIGKKPLSHKTLSDIRGTITNFCRFAQRSRMIDKRPDDLQIPRDAPKIGKDILTPEQFKMLFESSDDWYINVFRLMAVTGLRPGEAYGLKNSDIKDGILYIQRSLSERNTITPGKNKNARRTIKLHAAAQEIISEQRAMTASLNSPWTFCTPLGGVASPKVIYEHWSKWARPRGIQAPPYALRHTFVSMTQHDLPPEMAKRQVGHSESMDTFGVYGHEIDGELDKAATILDDVFSRYF